MVVRHVTVGARAAIAAQSVEAAVEEGAEAALDRVARLAAALVAASGVDPGVKVLRQQRHFGRAGSQQHHREHGEGPGDQH